MTVPIAVRALAAAALLALASPSFAQADPGGIVRLTPAQREAALEAGAANASDRPGWINGAPDRAIHGEIGAEIGTNGTRTLYGTAVIPLGQNGSATMSFLTGRLGRWQGGQGYYGTDPFIPY